ncbi:MAG: DEAD/DEAH box helicase [Acidobacteria bacterium]|nr:DEAD/DEAH box helicase [Acidobacteriota bacterium]MDA1235158.1 DEAD/DEAH box helicase [Acidobacteriota bacterium]
MNLALDFGESNPEKALAPARNPLARTDSSLERVVETFEAMHATPDSPITAIRRQPAREAEFVDLPATVDDRLGNALRKRGVEQLYSHQGEAFRQIQDGNNVVIVTPTASGKTLCYNLPVLNALLSDPDACALYLFPTKALSEDQLSAFNEMVDSMGSDIRAFTYDGDTPGDARRAIRRRANVVLTNPDMLHAGVLPHHTKWARFFEKLQYIVVDELHTYRGVFGSHLANVFRRLRRICAFYGSNPQFICCSATIANPRELAEGLTELKFAQVDRNGAPSGEKYFVCYNPPVVNRQLGIRRSYINEARRMAQVFLDRGRQTLVFANNRLATEILVRYLKDQYETSTDRVERIRGYRGGYLPRERREIERQLREGEILGVVSTSALELGVDIGSLDACVLAGYPGSIASTWQRAGRAGRRQSASVTVLVASSAPVDQYIIERPDYFFEATPERACINADNLEILVDHLKCAVFELPFTDGEPYGTHETAELLNFLKDVGVVHHAGNAWHWTSESYPADAINLRSISSDNFVVIDITGEAKVIGEVAFTAALTTLHEKAIYLHQGRLFHVEKFDYAERKAYVKSVECDYYTDAIDYTQVKILESFDDRTLGALIANHGEVRLNRQIIGFKKLKFYTNENVGAGDLQMPEQEMHTTSFWLRFPSAYLESFEDTSPTERQNGVVGLGNVLRTVGALLLMCDPRDLGVAVTGDTPDERGLFEPDLFLYDNYPGGIGQSEPLYRMREQLLQKARELIEACPCEAGCPGCVGPPGEAGDKAKTVALRLAAGTAALAARTAEGTLTTAQEAV